MSLHGQRKGWSKLGIVADSESFETINHKRPKTRSDCMEGGTNAERPCPWISCKHHLAMEVEGHRVFVRDGWEESGLPTCTLDVADEGPKTEDEIGQLYSLTRQRIQQIEATAIVKFARNSALHPEVLRNDKSP